MFLRYINKNGVCIAILTIRLRPCLGIREREALSLAGQRLDMVFRIGLDMVSQLP
jgi:hypothetical protein